MRTLTLARAAATSWLIASESGGASIASTATAGRVHRRDAIEPRPISETPGNIPVAARSSSSRDVDGRGLAGNQAWDRDIAVGIVQRSQDAAEHGEGIRHRSPPHTAVDAGGEGSNLHFDRDQAAERNRHRGSADAPVCGVGDHDHIGRESIAMGGEKLWQVRRSRLLLTLHEHLHTDRRSTLEGPHHPGVYDDAAFVVRRTATVEAAVAFGRLERRGGPLGVWTGRLDVVMCIQEHGGGSWWGGDLAEDSRVGPGRLEKPDATHAGSLEELCGPLRRSAHRLRVECRCADGRDSYQILEVGPECSEEIVDGRDQVVVHGCDATTHGRRPGGT